MQTWKWYQSSVQEDSVKSNMIEQEQKEGEGQDKKKQSVLCRQNATLSWRKRIKLKSECQQQKGHY